jgi:hypothetical protein
MGKGRRAQRQRQADADGQGARAGVVENNDGFTLDIIAK